MPYKSLVKLKKVVWNKGLRTGTYLGSKKNKADKAEYQRKWRVENPEKARLLWKDWEEKNNFSAKENNRRWHLRKYGMTEEDYNELLIIQGGLCAICKKLPTEKYFVIDHCHNSLKIRGLIHRTCNTAIGLLNDDANLVRLALEYLEKNNALEK